MECPVVQKTPRGCRTLGGSSVKRPERRPLSAPLRAFTPDIHSLHLAAQHRIGSGDKTPQKRGRIVHRQRIKSAGTSLSRPISCRSTAFEDGISSAPESDSAWAELYKLQELEEGMCLVVNRKIKNATTYHWSSFPRGGTRERADGQKPGSAAVPLSMS